MENQSGQHFWISGKVQNVFYRRFCQTEAQKLNLTGWAKNLADGRVEVKVFGEVKALAQFETLLWEGPMLADVTDVAKEHISFEPYGGFDVM